MLNIQRFVCNMFQENCYIVNDETGECAIVDCGAYYDEEKKAIAEYIRSNNYTPKLLLSTHGHIDHNYGNGMVYCEFGLQPQVHIADEKLMKRLNEQSIAFTGTGVKDDIPPVGAFFGDGDSFTFGSHTLTVMHTPGHTPGSVLLCCDAERLVFAGDTVFRMSIGRTDLPGGSYPDMRKSLDRISHALTDDTVILTGHGPQTTMGDERKTSPYIR